MRYFTKVLCKLDRLCAIEKIMYINEVVYLAKRVSKFHPKKFYRIISRSLPLNGTSESFVLDKHSSLFILSFSSNLKCKIGANPTLLPNLTYKCWTWMNIFSQYKHSSLFVRSLDERLEPNRLENLISGSLLGQLPNITLKC